MRLEVFTDNEITYQRDGKIYRAQVYFDGYTLGALVNERVVEDQKAIGTNCYFSCTPEYHYCKMEDE